jgi:hypothetical protein
MKTELTDCIQLAQQNAFFSKMGQTIWRSRVEFLSVFRNKVSKWSTADQDRLETLTEISLTPAVFPLPDTVD